MDYYNVLGVSKTATDAELKKAYKKLSMQHHPDRTGGDDTKFKEINEAYSTLKDPQKRGMYDHQQNGGGQAFNFNTSNMDGFARGSPFGNFGSQFNDIFQDFYFGGQRAAKHTRNKDIRIGYNIDLEDVFTGKNVSATYQLPSGKREVADITIPMGVRHGDTIRFAGLGDDSITTVGRGNLDVVIKIRPHRDWERDGDNLATSVNVDVFDLLLGGQCEIKLPNKRSFSLNIPIGTKPGTVFSIAGHGVPNSKTHRQGNVLVKIQATVPKISDTTLLNKIQEVKNAVTKSTK